MIQLRLVLLSAGLLAGLTGCGFVGLVGSSVRDAAEKKASVPAGTLIAGDGFTVRTPEDGLHAVRDQPRQGFLCLRFTTELMFFGAGSYNVFPFSLDTPAPTLRDAWSANAHTFFADQGRAPYKILSERTGTWRGQPAYFQAAYSPPVSHAQGFVVSSCLLRRGSKYYWVVRSVSLSNTQPDAIPRAQARCEKELPAFLNSLSFNTLPAA